MDTANYGHLSRQLKEVRDRLWASEIVGVRFETGYLDFLIPEINRLERIVNALESIGVNLDEEDIVALELLAKDGNYTEYKREFYEDFNQSVRNIQEIERDHEQDQASEAIARAGFVLDAEDGETWTKGTETVKIECVHPAESQYRWEFYSGHICEIGVSGEFHRLLKLIGSGNENNASTGADERFSRVVK